MKNLVFLAPILLVGCVSAKGILAPYTDIPQTCAEIKCEMVQLAYEDSRVLTARNVKKFTIVGSSTLVAFGYIPPEYAGIAAVGGAIGNSIELNTNTWRIEHLAKILEMRGCPSLTSQEVETILVTVESKNSACARR